MENFTNYNIYENRASKLSNGIMYHKMEEQETSNPIEEGASDAGRNERFFYATYNAQTKFVSNRSFSIEGISVSKYVKVYV
jgi:hypothetical protein